jgi:uncharacterized protein
MTATQIFLSLISGSLVGLSLGVIGGGGSILAVPLMVYVIGISSPHMAIGTSAVAVAASALINLFGHARDRNIKWPWASVFALAGVVGATLGAEIGKGVAGEKLLAGFGVLMIVIAALMLRPRRGGHNPDVRLGRDSALLLLPTLAGIGFGVGAMSGFFGIGGGFLHSSRTGERDLYAAAQCNWFVARLGSCLRRDNGHQLCDLWPCRLACRWSLRPRWRGRQLPGSKARPQTCFT